MSETDPREESEFQEGEGSAQEATPPLSDEEQEGDQTTHPAPEDDVGVPSDEELGKEGAGEGESP